MLMYRMCEEYSVAYDTLSDEELCTLAAVGDRRAEEEIVTRYHGLVRSCARPLFLVGGDGEDLIQEGMFGLIRAIREYDAQKEVSFSSFAAVCIRNRLYSALKMPYSRRTGSGRISGGGSQTARACRTSFKRAALVSPAVRG